MSCFGARGLFAWLALAGTALAQSSVCEAPGVVCGCVADPIAGTCQCDPESQEKIRSLQGCQGANRFVCIANFQFTPIRLEVDPGDTVAWVNVEPGCGSPPGSSFGGNCDARHTIDAFPPEANPDPVTSGEGAQKFLCSPFAPSENAGECSNTNLNRGSNVHCHTYSEADTIHYTCLTNPVHTALMHGTIRARSSPPQ
jgi:hypothetical protein